MKAYLGNQLLETVYRAFVCHHLAAQLPNNDAVEAALAYGTALASLISAVPAATCPVDERLDRPALWHSNNRQSAYDVLVPASLQQAKPALLTQDTASSLPGASQEDVVPWPAAKSQIVGLTRAQALGLFEYNVKPAGGLLLAMLQSGNRPERQRHAALGLLITFYGCSCNPFIEDADSASFYCSFHFAAFKGAYAIKDVSLSQQHLAALQALAKHKVSHLLCSALGCHVKPETEAVYHTHDKHRSPARASIKQHLCP